jgi:hypothetical protein
MVHGTFDPLPGRLIRAGLQMHMPQLEYHEVERCGHWPWLEKAASETFFALVREWLGRHAARPKGKISDGFDFLKEENGPSLSIDEMNEIAARGWAGER